MALAAVGTTALVDLSVHLFTDCDLQRRRWDLMPTERAKDQDRILPHWALLIFSAGTQRVRCFGQLLTRLGSNGFLLACFVLILHGT